MSNPKPHEFVIVARKPGAQPLYFTGDRKVPWSSRGVDALGIAVASKAYAKSTKVPRVEGARVQVEGAFGLAEL